MKRTAPSPLLKELQQQLGAEDAVFGDDNITCFRCMLCIRMCDEIVGVKALSLKKVKEGDTTPIALDAAKCILCGACATVCPAGHIQMEDTAGRAVVHQEMELGPNTAITLPFRQAVPNVPRIHTEDCIHFTHRRLQDLRPGLPQGLHRLRRRGADRGDRGRRGRRGHGLPGFRSRADEAVRLRQATRT